jgi:phage baseplate assembly protein W
MSRYGFSPALPLGSASDLVVPGGDALAYRVRQLLSTKPGDLPWLPDYGLDLRALVGEGATGVTLDLAKSRITQAINRWLPGVTVQACDVTVQPRETPGFRPDGPIERSLVPLGGQATLVVNLSLSAGAGGSAKLQLPVTP